MKKRIFGLGPLTRGFASLALVLAVCTTTAMAQVAPKRATLPNFDNRLAKSPGPAELPGDGRTALVALQASIPGVQVDVDPLTKTPKFIHSTQGFLTGPNGQSLGSFSGSGSQTSGGADAYQPVRAFLNAHQALFGFGAEILSNATTKRDSVAAHNGLRTVVWQQQLNGIPIFASVLIGNISKQGEVVTLASQFIPNAANKAEAGMPNSAQVLAQSPVTVNAAVQTAMRNVGQSLEASQVADTGNTQGEGFHVLRLSSGEAAYARQVWVPSSSSAMRLAWEVIVTSPSTREMFQELVDAETASVILRNCLTDYISDATYRVFTSHSPAPFSPGTPTPTTFQAPLVSRDLITTNAFSVVASPNGWINDGDNQTLGNNTDARVDRNGDGQPDGPRPQGNPNRVFDFAEDLTLPPINYTNAAVTQLFYWCNAYHDILYGYGFTEAAGNFQNDNFGRGGLGNDSVQANTQAGADIGLADNANFSTPPDGLPGVMNMYDFSGPNPRRDGDLDADVILHEHTHGLSTRLVGGGVGISALQTHGMGEGWSDFVSASFLAKPSDDPDATYPTGPYVTFQLGGTGFNQNYYFGIRHYPYCTDLGKNPFTLKDIDPAQISPHTGVPISPVSPFDPNEASEVHHQGEVWCATLWDTRANLVHKLGGDAGNKLMLQLVVDAMKLGPADPTFLEARDAIILADKVNTGGANFTELWKGFAKRGMGFNAVVPNSSTTTGVIENYELPGLIIVSTTVSGGNGNGVIDNNECNDLQIILRNSGSAPATDVSGRLTSLTPGAVVSQPVSIYPNMVSGGRAVNAVAFKLSTTADFVCGTPVKFSFVVKSDQDTRTNFFQLTSGTPGSPIRFDNPNASPIPDANPVGVASPVAVSGFNGGLGKVTVALNIAHTYVGDLTLKLIAPDGTSCILSSQNGGSGNNYGTGCSDTSRTIFDDGSQVAVASAKAPFVGTFAPDHPLAIFNGKSGAAVNGVWQLQIVDGFQGDVGTLDCWTLFLNPALCTDGGGTCAGVDLSLGMLAAPNPITLGASITYTIGVTNNGPQVAKDVTVNQTLPPGAIVVSTTSSKGSIAPSSGGITASLGTLNPGDSVQIVEVVTPTSTGTAFSTAIVGGSVTENDPSNNSATVGVVVNPTFTDMAIGLSANPNPAPNGSPLIYSVAVTNFGPYRATAVYVTNTLPVGVILNSINPSQGTFVINGSSVVCNLGGLGSGASALVSISVTPTNLGTITASATVVNLAQVDPIPGNNTASLLVNVNPAADLSVVMTGSPNSVIVRSNLSYAILVNNRGPNAAAGVTLTDPLPAGVRLLSATSSQGTIVTNANSLTFNLGALSAGGSATATVLVGATNIGILTNLVTVSSSQGDPNLADNTAAVITQVANRFTNIVAAGSSLIAESSSPANGAIDLGETVTVGLRLQNIGNVPNGNLIATLLPTGGVTAPSAAQTYGVLNPGGLAKTKNFTFTAAGVSGGFLNATLQLQDGTNNLGTVQYTFTLPTVTQFASSTDISIPDHGAATPYPSSITVSGITGLVGHVAVTLTNLNHSYPSDVDILLVSPGGQNVLLTAHAGDGNYPLTNVSLTFDDAATLSLPAANQIFSGTYKPTQYGTAIFPPSAPASSYDTVLSTLNGGNANGKWSLYVVDESPGDSGSILGGWSLAITAIQPLNQVADLALTASATPNPVLVASNLSATFVISNRGPNTATGLAFSNTLPSGVSFVSGSSSQGNVLNNGGSLYCIFTNSLAAGSAATVTVIVSPTVAGSLTNVASIGGNEIDLNLTNNLVNFVTIATPASADLSVSILTTNSVVVSSNLTYVVTATNSGPNTALGVVVTNQLPASLTNVQFSVNGGVATNYSSLVVWNLGSLVPGGSAFITLQGNPADLGLITNTVSIGSSGSDPAPGNNLASAITSVILASPTIAASGVELLAESAPANGVVDLGETVTVGLKLANIGSADTLNLTATLLATGGVTPVTKSQNYGSLVRGGAAEESPFTFTATSQTDGIVTATLQLDDGGTNLGTVSFVFNLPRTTQFGNAGGILIPDSGPAAPYPSTIVVSGATGLVSHVSVTLNGVSHLFPDDINALLVGPDGRSALLMSGSGGGHSISNLTLTFDDFASATLPTAAQILSGTYQLSDNASTRSLAYPAPARPYGALLTGFNGTSPNGNWQLYVFDSAAGDAGYIAEGWSLNLTTVNTLNPVADLGVAMTVAPAANLYAGITTFAFVITATNSGPANATGVTINDRLPAGLNLISAVASQGTVSNIEGVITANVGNIYAQSNATLTITVTAANPGTFVNSAAIAGTSTDLNPSNNLAQKSAIVNGFTPFDLTPGVLDANGAFSLTLTGGIGQTYVIQGSSDLITWTPLTTVTLTSASYRFLDNSSSGLAQRFYRAVFNP